MQVTAGLLAVPAHHCALPSHFRAISHDACPITSLSEYSGFQAGKKRTPTISDP